MADGDGSQSGTTWLPCNGSQSGNLAKLLLSGTYLRKTISTLPDLLVKNFSRTTMPLIEKFLWKFGLKGPIPSPPYRPHPRGPYAALHDPPRHQRTSVKLLDHTFEVADGFSFYWMHQEIFCDQVYAFKPSDREVNIIDCGGSYGVSALYFKSSYPDSKITVVEADPVIFSILSSNINNTGYDGITLLNRVVGPESGQMAQFYPLGADLGRIHSGNIEIPSKSIPTICLDDLIKTKTDFLKIDIEGAETDVLSTSKKLNLVDHLFVEYHSFEDTDQTLVDLLEILRENGFRYHIKTVFTPSNPFIKRQSNHGMDLQLGIYANRSHK